jgi:hypothetical protein
MNMFGVPKYTVNKGVEDHISNSGNDHDDGEATFFESHCLLLVL